MQGRCPLTSRLNLEPRQRGPGSPAPSELCQGLGGGWGRCCGSIYFGASVLGGLSRSKVTNTSMRCVEQCTSENGSKQLKATQRAAPKLGAQRSVGVSRAAAIHSLAGALRAGLPAMLRT